MQNNGSGKEFLSLRSLYHRDMRIAALEQSSAETEKIIADARSDRLKHLEEVYPVSYTHLTLPTKA